MLGLYPRRNAPIWEWCRRTASVSSFLLPFSHSNSDGFRLQKFARLAVNVSRIPVYDESDLEDWVHDDGPLVLTGDAAHPMPVRHPSPSPLFQFGLY